LNHLFLHFFKGIDTSKRKLPSIPYDKFSQQVYREKIRSVVQ